MELIRGIHNLRPEHRGCVVTIGNFDGVHRGHRAVLSGLHAWSEKLDVPTCVMTFEPQPLEFFAPAKAPARLMGFRDKYRCLAELGIDRLFVVGFNKKLASSAAEGFIRDVLVDGLNAKHIVIGDDFRFGHERRGDFTMLKMFGEEHGYSVEPTGTYRQDAERISSTRIREALSAGELAQAAELLGQPFFIEGRVIHGDKRGRTIGYPTANVQLRRQHTPVAGVFAVECVTADQGRYFGMANVGTRPTVDDRGKMSLEVNLFDFDRSIYGEKLRVIFHRYLRPEWKFDSLEEMVTAIGEDERQSRKIFELPPKR
ncbi:MAG: bifunctional riboflavin kinase/FAD synthetase [Pseudomonadota bacterium]